MTIVVPFKEGTVPDSQPQGGFLGEQERLCNLWPSKQHKENNVPTTEGTHRLGQSWLGVVSRVQAWVVTECGVVTSLNLT